MLTRLFFLLSIFAFSFHAHALTHSQSEYLTDLVKRANVKQLASHPEWLKLIHYDDNLFGYHSQIISRNFFNAPDGHKNPKAELAATLKAFFSDQKETDKEQNPQCRFVARYHWLDKHLGFDSKRLKRQRCDRFNTWVKSIDPEQVTLIFPAGTENSPSSMFGHTLFRIDKTGQTEKTRLFSYSINFAAETDETNGLVFAVKGIFGGYPGRFSTMPYYEKVKQYNDMESRDIWEYQLNLGKDETDRLLQHAWELGGIDFAYFFFLENCSYQLLALLDVARPGQDFAGKFSVWAIPGDTVTAILEDKSILKQAIYRPSVKTRLKYQIANLNINEQEIVLDLVFGRKKPQHPSIAGLSDKKKALVIITAYDYLQYLFNRGAVTQKTAGGRSLMLLRARNKIPVTETLPPVPAPAVRFDEGHGTTRVLFAGGTVTDANENESNFSEIRFRPSYHDLLDLQDGYTKGAQINFGDIAIRKDNETGKIRLHEFTLIDIFSLTARDRFFKPLSWHVSTGFIRMPQVPVGDSMLYNIDGGFGFNYGITDDFNMFGMLDVSMLFHDRLQDKYAIATGPRLGMYWRVMRYWNIWLSGRVLHYQDNLDMAWQDYRLETNIAFGASTALRLSASETGPKEHTDKEVKAALHWYF